MMTLILERWNLIGTPLTQTIRWSMVILDLSTVIHDQSQQLIWQKSSRVYDSGRQSVVLTCENLAVSTAFLNIDGSLACMVLRTSDVARSK